MGDSFFLIRGLTTNQNTASRTAASILSQMLFPILDPDSSMTSIALPYLRLSLLTAAVMPATA